MSKAMKKFQVAVSIFLFALALWFTLSLVEVAMHTGQPNAVEVAHTYSNLNVFELLF